MNQLDKLMEWTGKPTAQDIAAINSSFAATMLQGLPPLPYPEGRGFAEMFPNAPPDAIDLISRLLTFSPDKRLTAEEALRHPFVSQFHSPADEPICEHSITLPISDDVKYSVAEYRDSLYSEIVRRKKELRRRARERDLQRAARQGVVG